MEKKFKQQYKIYKPKKEFNGAASSFDFSKEKKCVFLEMATQLPEKDKNGNSTFDWENKLSYKLGPVDMAELLLVLQNIKNGVGPKDKNTENYRGLFHSSGINSAILKFERGKYDGYYLGLNVKKGESAAVSLKHSITNAEGTILQILLRRAIELIYDWT